MSASSSHNAGIASLGADQLWLLRVKPMMLFASTTEDFGGRETAVVLSIWAPPPE
jgi:hypothetical protein